MQVSSVKHAFFLLGLACALTCAGCSSRSKPAAGNTQAPGSAPTGQNAAPTATVAAGAPNTSANAAAGSTMSSSGTIPTATTKNTPPAVMPTPAGAPAPARPINAGAKPATGQGVSKPGQYTGYAEARYSDYVLSSEYVAVRDETKLAMDIFRPANQGRVVAEEKFPVLFMNTPYNRRTFALGGMTAATYPGEALQLVKYGYVVAVADFRGLYASYGKNTGYNRGEWAEAARFDAYDLVEWLAARPYSTGKVGMWGCSATGGSQLQAATTAPPSLKAIFPMSCEFDAYSFGVPGAVSPAQGDTRAPPTTVSSQSRDTAAVPVDGDQARTQLNEAFASHTGSFDNPGYVPFRDSVSAALQVPWWIVSSPHTYLADMKRSGIAFYLAANWDEAATKYGAFFTFNNLDNPRKLVIGPQTHCGWSGVRRDQSFDIVVEELRFFDHWLKGVENGVMYEAPVTYYTYNAPAGQEWRSAMTWPLPNERRTRYFLGAKSLAAQAPAPAQDSAAAADMITVRYDVTAQTRASVGMSYVSEPLAEALEMTGHPVVNLWVSSTATDGDFVATLEDIDPDGSARSYNMEGKLRASQRATQAAPYDNLGLPWHRSHAQDAQPLAAGTPVELAFDLLPISYIFAPGHRIRLVLTFADSAATPRISPAPQVTIHRDAAHPSSITLPIIPKS